MYAKTFKATGRIEYEKIIKLLVSLLTIEFASKPKMPKMPKTNILPIANDNFVIIVIKEKSIPEISSLNCCLCISVKSAWIEGGRTKSAPKQNPVRHEIIINKNKSPDVKNTAKIKKNEDVIREIDHALALFVFLLKKVQNGIPIIANKK